MSCVMSRFYSSVVQDTFNIQDQDAFKKYSEDTRYEVVSSRYFLDVLFGRYFCTYLLFCLFVHFM